VGIRRTYTATEDGVKIAGYADRHREGPEGIFGGSSGGTGSFTIVRFDGIRESLPTSYEAILNSGDQIIIETGGGGGYGDKHDRSDVLATQDRLNHIGQQANKELELK
jgi:N-methylhydantoinase B